LTHPDRYLDDLQVGDAWESGPFSLSEVEILDFAKQFDPQPMHMDPVAAAEGRFGGLIASGWHVASRVMRDFVDLAPFGVTPMLGMRIDDLCWLHPVRPGDELRVRREIVAVTPSRTRPDRGTIRTATTVTNQDCVVVLTFFNLIQMPVRSGVAS
jgi:acyl dehydratase